MTAITLDLTQLITPEDKVAAAFENARAAIRARRDVALRAGTTVGGVPVHTDDISQQRIMGAAVSAMLDPDYTVQWKTADGGFVVLIAPQVLGIAQAVRAHVQACFNREAELVAALDAGQDLVLETGWPT